MNSLCFILFSIRRINPIGDNPGVGTGLGRCQDVGKPKEVRTADRHGASDLSMACVRRENPYPMGVKVSIPLAADQGRPFDFATSWTFLAVISTARAGKHKNVRRKSEMRLNTHCSRQCDSVRPFGGCPDLELRSRGQVRLEGVCEFETRTEK